MSGIDKDKIKQEYGCKFLNLYEYSYEEGGHYYWASRRPKDRLIAPLTLEEHKKIQADAVSCFVVLQVKGEPKRLLLNWEYRYPVGQYLLSVPAGIIDPEDREKENALEITAARELYEETGILISEQDEVHVINPCVYSTPGMADETNALVYMAINRDSMPPLTHGHTVGAEKFEGFKLLTKEDAEECLKTGRDERGMFYPLYTWAALMFFMGV